MLLSQGKGDIPQVDSTAISGGITAGPSITPILKEMTSSGRKPTYFVLSFWERHPQSSSNPERPLRRVLLERNRKTPNVSKPK